MTEQGKTKLLVASLLANALLAGFVLGQVRGEAFERAALRHVQETASVSPALDTVLSAAFDTERLAISDAVRDARAAQEDAVSVVRRDPLDLDHLDEALARIRSSDETALAAMHRALRSAAAKLDPKNRDIIADVLDAAPPAGAGFTERYRWAYLRRLLF
jgi:uncharacterized membrane protein